jgi:hypothetical protein
MNNSLRMAFATLFALQLSGCMTFEGPDHKYVLTQEGFKEVAKDKPKEEGVVAERNQSVQAQKTTSSSDSVEKSPNNANGAYGWLNSKIREPSPMNGFQFTYSKDIDSTYVRLKREFGFLSLDDLKHNDLLKGVVEEKGVLHLRYEATPGVYYKMRNWVEHSYGNEEPYNTIQIELSKEGNDKVLIVVSYYSGSTHDSQGYEASLRSRIEQALR